MFEKECDGLLREYNSLLNRMEKGQEMLKAGKVSEEDYNKQYDYLDSMVLRASTCIDILNDSAIVVTKPDGTRIVERRV